jgi:hypothetical protein
MREVSAHAQNDNCSVAAEIFSISTYFPNTPRTYVGRHNTIILEEGKCLQVLVYLRNAQGMTGTVDIFKLF